MLIVVSEVRELTLAKLIVYFNAQRTVQRPVQRTMQWTAQRTVQRTVQRTAQQLGRLAREGRLTHEGRLAQRRSRSEGGSLHYERPTSLPTSRPTYRKQVL